MRKKNLLARVISTIAVFILLETVSIAMISQNDGSQKYQIMDTVRGVQMFFWNISDSVRRFFRYSSDNKILIAENAELKEALATYKYSTPECDSSFVPKNRAYNSIPATIIKNSTNKQHNYLIINKGEKDGVKKGMGVVSSKGVVGIVNDVSDSFAYVVSFLNTSQSISAKIKKSDIFGPLQWDGRSSNTAILNEIPLHANVAQGDTISTSGYSAIFPADIPVGVVRGQNVIDGVFLNVDVELFQDFRAIRYVEVIGIKNIDEINLLSND